MKFSHLLAVFVLFFGGVVAAQNSKEVLFTIDETPFYTDEFVRVYKKNLDLVKDESQKDLDNYLQLFVGYKLKIQKAHALGLQHNTNYKNELQSYRTQLAKNYLTDSKVTKELVDEAFRRMQKEVRASHILLLLDENAKPNDTLAVYQRIKDLQKRAENGEDFAMLAETYSEDPSAKENKGDLGYFSVFRMVYPFENAAFTTPKGKVSKIVRTRFGYHLLYVTDVRDNRGEITVAHIMVMNPTSDDAADQVKAKTSIQEVYTKLQQGESFEDLAKQFSQDKSTSSKGGVLNRFGSGQLSSEEFENKAFSLQTPSQISEPFQTQYGWHIVKLIEKHPLKTIEELTPELEDKISKDERSRLIANSLTEKLRKKYKVTKNKALLDKLTKVVTDAVYEGTWEVPSNIKEYTGVLFSFENQKITGDAFLSYLHSQQKSAAQPKPVSRMVATNLDAFIDQQLNQYYNDTLENEFPEFSAVMDEYRDGLLLFELMEKEIWEKSKTDSLGLAAFHLKNIQKYQWKKRYNVVLLSTTKADIAKKAHKLLGKNKTAADIKVALNQNDVINIMAHEGVYEEGVDLLPKTVTYQKGMLPIVQEGNYFYVISVKDILPSGPKLLEECRGRVVNDYQQYLEENWVSSLKEEYKVQVNQPVFEKVKQQIKK